MSPSVLLVEDDDDLREVLEAQLAIGGFDRIVAVGSRRAAFSVLHSGEPPGLIILDLVLSDGSGEDVVEEVRSNSRLQDVAILVVTGLHYYARSGVHYLRKPFNTDAFLDAVRECCEAPPAPRPPASNA